MVKRLLSIGIIALLSACQNDGIQKMYSTYHARFYYNKVLTAAPLLYALNNPGEFCGIYTKSGYLYFYSLNNSYSIILTSVANYSSFSSIAGFIVGKGNIPEMGTLELPLLCFDRACPNCYDSNISRPLELKEGGYAYCSRCKRTYNLNNLGTPDSLGKKLERYHISYNGDNILNIYNN